MNRYRLRHIHHPLGPGAGMPDTLLFAEPALRSKPGLHRTSKARLSPVGDIHVPRGDVSITRIRNSQVPFGEAQQLFMRAPLGVQMFRLIQLRRQRLLVFFDHIDARQPLQIHLGAL